MVEAEAEEIPKGLTMSLDELIRQDRKPGQQRQQKGNQGHRRDGRGHQGGRGRGPAGQGRGGGRGRFNDMQQQRWQGGPPQQGAFANPGRMVTVDTGAQQGQPGMGPILLLPPEFLAQQGGGGFGASAGPFMPMHMMGGGFPGQMPGPGPGFRQPQQPAAPRTRETCHEGEQPGEVIVRLRKQDVLKVSRMGDVTLDTGGTKTQEMFRTLNNALSPLGVRLTDSGNGNWSISDGKSLTRFHDGVVLASKGAASAQRAKALLAHYKPGAASASAAATAASNAAAAAMGLLPGSGGFGSPSNGFGYEGTPVNGIHGGPDRAQQRRMKAQGRYSPY